MIASTEHYYIDHAVMPNWVARILPRNAHATHSLYICVVYSMARYPSIRSWCFIEMAERMEPIFDMEASFLCCKRSRVYLPKLRHYPLEPRPKLWTSLIFGRPFVKRFAFWYRSVVCLCVCESCSVGVLWPNGWIDHDATWYGGMPRPSDTVLDGDPAPPKKGHSP